MPEWPKEEHSKFRTECWLERCLFEKRVCSLEENVTYAPLLISSPPEGTCITLLGLTTYTPSLCSGASKFLVAFSGLDSFERTWVSRLLRSLGRFPYTSSKATAINPITRHQAIPQLFPPMYSSSLPFWRGHQMCEGEGMEHSDRWLRLGTRDHKSSGVTDLPGHQNAYDADE